MKQDRFLLGILIFIGLLVIAALMLFFVRKDAQTYGPEDTPDGVVRNYALALQNRDYQRAYGYLAEKENKPTYDTFHRAFLNHQLDVSTAALKIGAVDTSGNNEATVEVTIVFASGGPFSSSWDSAGTATLEKQNGAWRITYLQSPYWGWDWYQPTPVKP